MDIKIQTNRLELRLIQKEDWKSIRKIWLDFKSSEFVYYDTPKNTDETDVKDRINRWAKASIEGNEHIFLVSCLNNHVIGFFSLNAINIGYEIGYGFLKDFQGYGYARESIEALLEYLKSIGVKNITAGTALNNIPSVNLLKSTGFIMTNKERVSFYKDENGNDIYFDGGIFINEL